MLARREVAGAPEPHGAIVGAGRQVLAAAAEVQAAHGTAVALRGSGGQGRRGGAGGSGGAARYLEGGGQQAVREAVLPRLLLARPSRRLRPPGALGPGGGGAVRPGACGERGSAGGSAGGRDGGGKGAALALVLTLILRWDGGRSPRGGAAQGGRQQQQREEQPQPRAQHRRLHLPAATSPAPGGDTQRACAEPRLRPSISRPFYLVPPTYLLVPPTSPLAPPTPHPAAPRGRKEERRGAAFRGLYGADAAGFRERCVGVAVAAPSLPPSLSRIVPLFLVGAVRPGPWALGGAASGRGPRRLLGNSGRIAEDGGGDAQLPQGTQDGCGETRGRQGRAAAPGLAAASTRAEGPSGLRLPSGAAGPHGVTYRAEAPGGSSAALARPGTSA